MKNMIRGAALWIGGTIGFSAFLTNEGSLEDGMAFFFGIVALIGLVLLIKDPLIESFKPNKEKKDNTPKEE